MRSVLLVIGAILYVGIGHAQEIAITQSGDTVLLYNDGTWEYLDAELAVENVWQLSLPQNETAFERSKKATKKVQGSNAFYELWYNDKEWRRVPAGTINEAADLVLNLKNKEAYLMVIYERIEIPVENLLRIAIQNAKNAATEVRVVNQEYRTVNNTQIAQMQLEGVTNGIAFTYFSYYYSDERGTIQATTFTGRSLFEQYKNQMEELLNGLVIPR